jgi:hypothetical protein
MRGVPLGTPEGGERFTDRETALHLPLERGAVMIYPVIPEDKKIIINVENNRYIVSRFVQTRPYAFVVQSAANWEDLETEARQAVEDLVGAPIADYYPCPDGLAEQAVWPEQGEEYDRSI